MTLNDFLQRLDEAPEMVMLADTLETIDALYEFTPVAFSNGDLHNAAGEAPRSCRLYAFAQLHGLSAQQTLRCFGEHYREVAQDPNGSAHQTIRIFMKTGFEGLRYEAMPIQRRALAPQSP